MTPNSLDAAALTPTTRKICNCNLAIGGHVAQTSNGHILQGDEVGHVPCDNGKYPPLRKKFCCGEKSLIPQHVA